MITVDLIKKVEKDLLEALKPIEEKYNIGFDVGKIKYDKEVADIELSMLSLANGSKDAEHARFIKEAPLVGLKASDYLSIINNGTQTLKIIGVNPRARKYPIIAEDIDSGSVYKLPLEAMAYQEL